MYKIYCDNNLIYDSSLPDFVITKGVITKELNKSGSFVFTVYESNPFYNLPKKLKSLITVYQNDELIFRGRVIKESIGFYKDKTFTCEGELGFLQDSIKGWYGMGGPPEYILSELLREHNSKVDDFKKFTLGEVTVDDSWVRRENIEWETTFDNIQTRLLDTIGGYLFITSNDAGERVLNWYKESPYMSNQTIEFGENLLDFTRDNKAEDIFTALIPFGGEIEDEINETTYPLQIKDVNDGVEYVYNAEAVEAYGWIFRTMKWSDITDAETLKAKAEEYLAEKVKQSITIEVSAIDLSLMDKSINSFRLGDNIRIVSAPHNLDDYYLLKKQTIDLLKPDNDKITLGYSYASFTDRTVSANKGNTALIKTIESIKSNYATNATVKSQVTELQSQIDQTGESITLSVQNEISTNEDLQSLISTTYTQLHNTFEFMFKNLDVIVNENDADTRARFSNINKYIRFEDGNIIIGEIGNPLVLKLQHDRISFLENDAEVAYISGNKINITDANILSSLRIGNYAYIPRETGHLSLVKVRA